MEEQAMTNRSLVRTASMVAALSTGVIGPQGFGQGQPAAGGSGRGAVETWWVNKTAGGAYKPPMRPLWKLSDLKQMHVGENTWSEQIILDPEQEATYHSGATGTKYTARLHPDTPVLFVIIAGQVQFDVEGQSPATAVRGSIVNILKSTIFSYEVTGSQNALWVEVNSANSKTVYPSGGPPPAASKDGTVVKVAFEHQPPAYVPPNRLNFNTFTDSIDACKSGPVVIEDHLFVNPLLGYLDTAEDKCASSRSTLAASAVKNGEPPFNPQSTFGHMHSGPAEWWIVQAGQIGGKFENTGEFHAAEGDVLYAPPMTWHQMAAEGPSGPSVRLAISGYQLINMNSMNGVGGR
jgi:mannose-6-phosphate isomerase-like protein (cupin superfamily)